MISANLAAIFYLVSGVLFILALRGLSSPDTSRQGNYFGIAGMAISIIVTFLSKSRVAASIGRAAFLLPEIDTSPLILEGPLILNLSILNFGKRYPFLAHIFSISIGI